MSDFLHEYVRMPLRFRLTADGKLMVKNLETGAQELERPWFKDDKTGKPWLVKSAKGFKGLVSMADRDGDYDEMKKGR